MKIIQTPLEGAFEIIPDVYEDERGYFFEAFQQEKFKEATGLDIKFVQDNESFSTYGVLRGLHYQNPPYAQTKLIRVLHGRILDVAVDIRPKSPTFLKHLSVELTKENRKQLFVPKGFAHGFVVLSEAAEILYKCDEFYNPQSEGCLHYNATGLDIDWKIPLNQIVLSEKDAKNPGIENMRNEF